MKTLLIIFLVFISCNLQQYRVPSKSLYMVIIANDTPETIYDVKIQQLNGTSSHRFHHIDSYASNYTYLPTGGYEVRATITGDLFTGYFDLADSNYRFTIN